MEALVWFSAPREMTWDAPVRKKGMKRKMSISEVGIFGDEFEVPVCLSEM